MRIKFWGICKGNREYIQISVKNKMQNNEDLISIRFYGNLV